MAGQVVLLRWGDGVRRPSHVRVPRGWTLVNDIDVERGNVDHILVGPAGVFLLETKSLGGIASVERGALTVRWREDPDDGYVARNVAPRTRALAARLAEWLRDEGAPGVWVQPIVVLWCDFAQGAIQSGGVAWVAGKRLALAQRPHVYSDEQVGEIVAALRSAIARHHDDDPPAIGSAAR